MRFLPGIGSRVIRSARRRILGTITQAITQEPVVSLTFDDGPHPEFTPQLLEILERHRARATFFVVGEAAHRQPELLHQLVLAGHVIGNHTWDHPSLPRLSGAERRQQILRCKEVIAPYDRGLFRPPFGHQNPASRLDAARLGYQVVTWNAVGYDWLDHDGDWIVDDLTRSIQCGSIILLHDALYQTLEERYADRSPTLAAVDMLLDRLSRQFRFVTVPELLQSGRPGRKEWYQAGDTGWLNQLERQAGEARHY